MPIQPGLNLGAYEVQEFIGQGAMGVVYRAYHPGLARVAAVKVLSVLAPDSDAGARFRREAQSIAQMRHPNILNVFDFGEFEGTPYMVVEYMSGGSLGDRLRAGKQFDRETTLRLLDGIAAGLDYAHGLGIIHRDVKPANVLVDGHGNPVLADFGLAKLLQSASVKTVSGVTTGTPGYMSPEQVMGIAVGPACDTYALATMAYEFLVGAIPFDGEGVLEVLYAHVHREPPTASSRNPELTPAVDAVLARGLAKDPAARWESGAEMVSALRSAVAPAPVERTVVIPPAPPPAVELPPPVPPSAAPTPVARRPSRRRWLLAGVGAVLLLFFAIGLFLVSRPQPAVSVSPTTVGGGGSVTVTATGFTPGATIDVYYVASSAIKVRSQRADTKGALVTSFAIPSQLIPGTHQVRACSGPTCATATLTVAR